MARAVESTTARSLERTEGGGAAASGFLTAEPMRLAAGDADELAESLNDWDIELTQLQPGAFDAHLTLLPLGPALICRGRYNQSLLQHVGPPAGCLSITRPGRGSDPVAVFGQEVQPGDVVVAGSGAEAETMSHGLLFPTTLSLQLSFLQAQTDWLNEVSSLPSTSLRLQAPGEPWVNNFLDAIEWIMDAVSQYPEATSRHDVRGSWLDILLARVNTLGAARAPVSQRRETRVARALAVERARDYIHTNLTEPIRLSTLCKHARAQSRSLEYGFREAFGVSPVAYIRATRLHRVRRLLRSNAVRTRSISEIALDCGFWHLSQFAVDYKRLFAESPSVTYRRTQAQLPRVGRRIGTNVPPPDSVRIPTAARRASNRQASAAAP